MDTWEMVQTIRGQLMEFDENPISNTLILRNMNLVYNLIFNRTVKANDAKHGAKVSLKLKCGVSEYDLPKEVWGKRVEQFLYTYYDELDELEKVDFKEVFKHASNDISPIPDVWSQLGNKIYVYPPVASDMQAYLVISKTPEPLGISQGRIVGIEGNRLVLDQINTDILTENLSKKLNNVISVSDYRTGDVKHLFAYSSIQGSDIYLTNSVRKSYLGKNLTQVYSTDFKSIDYDTVTKKCRVYLLSKIENLVQGDLVAIRFDAVQGTSYVSEFYSNFVVDLGLAIDENPSFVPPDLIYKSNPFSKEVFTLTAVGADYIEFVDSNFTPVIVDGYWSPTPPNPAVARQCVILNATQIQVNNAVATALKPYLPLRVTFQDPNNVVASLEYVELKNEGVDDTILTVSKTVNAALTDFVITEVSAGYTGVPETLSYDFSLTPQTLCSAHKNAPAVFVEKYKNATEEYDPINNIEIDDVVTAGLSTGTPIFGSEYDELIINHVVLKIRSGLNENDPAILDSIRENMKDLGSDTAGRVMGVNIQRSFSRGSNYTRPGRR